MSDKMPKSQPAASGHPKKRAEKIGQQLRSLYDSVAQEEVPDDFMKLLEQADKATSSSAGE